MAESPNDIELSYWNALRGGDAGALEWLYNCYFGLLYNYGRKLSADERSLEDCIHDLFVDLWRFRSNLSPTTSVKFYLYRSLRRRLARSEQQKKNEQLSTVPEYPRAYNSSKEEDIIETERRDGRVTQLKKLLADLSPRQYEAMVLRFYDELSFEEIAKVLDVNEQSARNLIQRGLAQLKQFSRYLTVFLLLAF